MAGDSKLDMSLDALIKNSRNKKPAAGAKKPAAGGAAGKKPAAGQQQKKQLQKPGIKAKPGQQQQQQQQQKKPVQKLGLKAKGGITKAGGGGAARPAPKIQQRGRQPDVRVVPRPQAGGPALRGAPPMPRQLRGGYPMQQPMGYATAYMPAHQMMAPMMPMAAPMMQQQAQQQAPQAGGKWNDDLFDGSVVSSNTSSKLLISNLDHKVTDEDIRELFGTVGTIKESGVHYDRNGRSAGTAFVVFERRTDALAAFNRYNNVALDNKKMSIEVVEQAVPRGTFKTLSSGINVSRAQQQAAQAAGVRGRGMPHGDFMQE